MITRMDGEMGKQVERATRTKYETYSVEQLSLDPEFENNTLDELMESLNEDQFEALWELQEELGVELYLTGGIVRDALIGAEPKDFDFIARMPVSEGVDSSDPQEIRKARESFEDFFGEKKYREDGSEKWVIKNKKYGTLVLEGEGFGVYKLYPPDGSEPIDIAFPRTEQAVNGAVGGARDFDVQSNMLLDVSEDVGRRDFTVNALVMKLERDDDGQINSEINDYVDGVEDLKGGVLRAVGSAYDRLSEDHTRIMRAVRFEVQKGLEMDSSLEAAIIQLVAEGALHKKRADGKWVVPPEVMAPQFLKGLVKDPAKMIRRLDELGILDEYLPDLKSYQPLDSLPYSLKERTDLLEDRFPDDNQRIRQESLERAIAALDYHSKQQEIDGYEATVDEYLFLLLGDLGKNQALLDYERDGRSHFKKEYRDLSGFYVDSILKSTKLNSLSAEHSLKVHPEQVKSMLERHQLAIDFLHPHYMEHHGEINLEKALKAFPNLSRDPLWRVMKSEVLTSSTADNRLAQVEWVESQLKDLEAMTMEKPFDRVEQLLTGRVLSQIFLIPPSRDIGELKAEMASIYLNHVTGMDLVSFESDREVKRIIFAQMVSDPVLRERWKPARENDRTAHVLLSGDVDLFRQNGDEREVTGMMMRAITQRVCERYVGESLVEAADKEKDLSQWVESREWIGGFGDRFVGGLATDPEGVIAWLESGFSVKNSFVSVVFPELREMSGCEQDDRHLEGDVWQHTKKHFEVARERGIVLTPELALAMLLHDSGKPGVQSFEDDGKIRFINHEPGSVEVLRKLASRLDLGTSANAVEVEEVERAIRDHHIFYGKPEIRLLDIRRYLPNGTDDILLKLIECDIAATVSSESIKDDFKSEDLVDELKRKASLVERERSFPGLFDELIESAEVQEVIGVGSVEEKKEVLFEAFLHALDDGVPGSDELIRVFLTKSERWTIEYVKKVIAPGRTLIDEFGFRPGPDIGSVQKKIARKYMEGNFLSDGEVSRIIADHLVEMIV